jgi:hypothetical protein
MNTVAVIKFQDDQQGMITELMMSLKLYLQSRSEHYSFDADRLAQNEIFLKDFIAKQENILERLKSSDTQQIASALEETCKLSERYHIVKKFLDDNIGTLEKFGDWRLYDTVNWDVIKQAVIDMYGPQESLARHIKIVCLFTGDLLTEAIEKAVNYIKTAKIEGLMAVKIGDNVNIDSIQTSIVQSDTQLDAIFNSRREIQAKLVEAAGARELVKSIAKSINTIDKLSEVKSQVKFQITENDVIASALE